MSNTAAAEKVVMTVYTDAEKWSPISAFFAEGIKPQMRIMANMPRYAKSVGLFLSFIISLPCERIKSLRSLYHSAVRFVKEKHLQFVRFFVWRGQEDSTLVVTPQSRVFDFGFATLLGQRGSDSPPASHSLPRSFESSYRKPSKQKSPLPMLLVLKDSF